MLGRHDGAQGRAFDAHYRALEEQHGPFTSQLSKQYAAAAAAWWSQFQSETRSVKQAEDARMNGKGRRPSDRDIARLKKRQGLSWQSYEKAIVKIEAWAAQQPSKDWPEMLGGRRG
jgi:hypothetical protein